VVFKAVGDSKPYPEHNLTLTQWAQLPPQQLRLNDLITTKS